MLVSAGLLGMFAVFGTGLVAFTYTKTAPAIAKAERLNLLQKLHSVVEKDEYDNDLFTDFYLAESREWLGGKSPLPIFRARKQGHNVAAILNVIAPDGYNGDIKLLIGLYTDGRISGVRVINHRETPGLGDAIEERRSDWILAFNGLKQDSLPEKKWKVRRDGGQFDQFTGATITPRAVVKAVHKALQYFKDNKDQIFKQPSLIAPTATSQTQKQDDNT